MLGVSSGSGLSFFDWETLKLVRRIDIQPTHVYWAENASLIALATADQYFILKYHSDAVANASESAEDIEDAFEVQYFFFTISCMRIYSIAFRDFAKFFVSISFHGGHERFFYLTFSIFSLEHLDACRKN